MPAKLVNNSVSLNYSLSGPMKILSYVWFFFHSKNVPWMAKALTFQIGSYVARWISLLMTCSSLISKFPHVIQTSDLTEMYSSSKHFKNTGRSFAVIIPTKKWIDQFIKSIIYLSTNLNHASIHSCVIWNNYSKLLNFNIWNINIFNMLDMSEVSCKS